MPSPGAVAQSWAETLFNLSLSVKAASVMGRQLKMDVQKVSVLVPDWQPRFPSNIITLQKPHAGFDPPQYMDLSLPLSCAFKIPLLFISFLLLFNSMKRFLMKRDCVCFHGPDRHG